MTGHVRKRGATWEVILDWGEQPARRCPACARTVRVRNGDGTVSEQQRSRLLWDLPRACPSCGGSLEDVVARRQESLPDRLPTKKGAQAALRKAITEREQGAYVAPTDLTVAQYLKGEWLPSLAARELSENTRIVYKLHVGRIVPVIGDRPLQKLTRRDVANLATHLATTKGARGKILSAATRAQCLVVLRHALGDAVDRGLLRDNPATGVRRPQVKRAELTTWTAGELRIFLQMTESDRLGPLWRLLSQTAMRRGEALGLQWSDVDLVAGKIIVQRQRKANGYAVEEGPTKTGKARVVSIDAATVATLRRQSELQLQDARDWGDAWQATGHVFTREDGSPWHPDRVSKLFDEAVRDAGVPRIRLHDLRHTWATLALRAGVHPKVVQERLGHANISMTMDRYSHALPDLQESAAELVAALVDGSGA